MRKCALTNFFAALFAGTVVAAPADRATTYVGSLPGEGTKRIALVVKGPAVLAYVCSDSDAFNQAHAQWFAGDFHDGIITVQGTSLKLRARRADGMITGTLLPGAGEKTEFTAKPIQSPTAGLYRAELTDRVAGWIVDDAHTVVGCSKSRKVGPAVTLKPLKPLAPPAKNPAPPVTPAPAETPEDPPAAEAPAELEVRQASDDEISAARGEKVTDPESPPKGTPLVSSRPKSK